jgi:hypothetical protein
MQKDLDIVKQENKLIKEQLISQQEFTKHQEEFTRHLEVMSKQNASISLEDSKTEQPSRTFAKQNFPSSKNLTMTLNDNNWDDWNFELRATPRVLLVNAIDIVCGAKEPIELPTSGGFMPVDLL